MSELLKNHYSIITGASRGIGKASALHLASLGSDVALIARDEARLEEVASQCREFGVNAIVVACDVKNHQQLEQQLHSAVEQLGGLDILIVNQGIADARPFIEQRESTWRDIIEINLVASMQITQNCLPSLIAGDKNKHRGIFYIASVAAKNTNARVAAYCASKHGLLGFANCIFDEVREEGIKVSCICPGFVNTDMASSPKLGLDMSKTIQPSDIAELIGNTLIAPITACPVEILLRPQFSPYLNRG